MPKDFEPPKVLSGLSKTSVNLSLNPDILILYPLSTLPENLVNSAKHLRTVSWFQDD